MSTILENLVEGNLTSGSLMIGANGAIEKDFNSILDKAGLNWDVNKVPLMANDKPSGFYGTQRSDNGFVFGAFKDGYQIFQNKELAELVFALSDHFGFDLHGGGSFNGGGKVYLQLKEEDVTGFGTNNDRIEKYITAINSHDGSTSLAFGSSNITISCQNTFYRAYAGMKNKVRHTSSMKDRVAEAINQIKGLQVQEQTMFERFFSFVGTPATPNDIKFVVEKVFKVNLDKTSTELTKELSTRALNQVNDVCLSIQSEMQEKGNNFWGLFSGFTHYTTHKLSAPKRENGRFETKIDGRAQEIDKLAYDCISAII